jgi:hypothetical protein
MSDSPIPTGPRVPRLQLLMRVLQCGFMLLPLTLAAALLARSLARCDSVLVQWSPAPGDERALSVESVDGRLLIDLSRTGTLGFDFPDKSGVYWRSCVRGGQSGRMFWDDIPQPWDWGGRWRGFSFGHIVFTTPYVAAVYVAAAPPWAPVILCAILPALRLARRLRRVPSRGRGFEIERGERGKQPEPPYAGACGEKEADVTSM